MKKFILSFISVLCFFHFSKAQKAELFVKSGDRGLYLEHKVMPKESFFSVGRLYNLNPKEIAAFNRLDINKGLFIDQKIKIPLTDTNFAQTGNSGTPVYYKTGEKDDLARISESNNVSLEKLRNWNSLSGDNLKEGQKLIIGFLLTKEMPAITIKAKPPKEEPVQKTDAEKPVTAEPVLTEKEKKEEKKEAKAEEKADKKEEKKDDQKVPDPVVVVEQKKPIDAGQGYFKTHFDQQIRKTPVTRDETVTAGIFKTLSGWQDAKYYLLIDAVQPGTIVRIINPTNNKTIYAKVLGEMSGIRQNEGYNIRISNAAASALEIAEQEKFVVKVNY